MAETPFVTLDVFTNERFGGNPLVIFPEADNLTVEQMKLLSKEFNLSEAVFLLAPEDPANTARARIFTSDIELDFAGHPSIGAGWLLARQRQLDTPRLQLEMPGGLVSIAVDTSPDGDLRCRVAAPKALQIGAIPDRAALADCAGLDEADLGDTTLASVALATACVEVSPDALTRARCVIPAFEAIARSRPDLSQIFLLFLYARNGDQVRARMFAPLSNTVEDPATGSAACALTAMLLGRTTDERLDLTIVQGVEMGRRSLMHCTATREGHEIRASVSGGCVPVARGTVSL